MRTTTWQWMLGVGAAASLLGGACGDDTSTTGGGGSGGSPTTTTSTTSTVTTTSTTSSSTSSTGDGGGGGMQGPTDQCPGGLIEVSPGPTPIVIAGSTADATDDFKTFCADTAAENQPAPDVVVQLDIAAACSMEATLVEAGGFDGALSLRRTQCDPRVAGDQCFANPAGDASFAQHMEPGTYWLVIDGDNGTSGDFTLNITCTAPACGDGILNPGEQCDYLPAQPNDGCGDPMAANECQVEAQAADDACPGTPVTIDLNGNLCLPSPTPGDNYNTVTATDGDMGMPVYKGSCMPGGENGGKDQVFEFTPTATGTLTVSIGEDCSGNPTCILGTEPECWDHWIYAREGSCTGAEVACDSYDANLIGVASFPVQANTPYWVFVDGLNAMDYSAGPYKLHVTLTP